MTDTTATRTMTSITTVEHGQDVYIDEERLIHRHQQVFFSADYETEQGYCVTAQNGKPGPAHPEFTGFIALANVIALDPSARTKRAPTTLTFGQHIRVTGHGDFIVTAPQRGRGDAALLTPVS